MPGPPPPPPNISNGIRLGETGRHQTGATVTKWDDAGEVEKKGRRVHPNEEAALRLVAEHMMKEKEAAKEAAQRIPVEQTTKPEEPDQRTSADQITKHEEAKVPVPAVRRSHYGKGNDRYIVMDYIEGEPLNRLWEDENFKHDDEIKEILCRQIWDIILAIRKIPKPEELAKKFPFQCGADGSTSQDVLIEPYPRFDPNPLPTDAALRQRICDRYFDVVKRRPFPMPDQLPLSTNTVFTHADIAPRNIIINGANEECRVVGLVDWESAGWYPDYWEVSNMMNPNSEDDDWKMWMKKTAPQELLGTEESKQKETREESEGKETHDIKEKETRQESPENLLKGWKWNFEAIIEARRHLSGAA